MKIPIILTTEYVLMGATLQALQEAFRLRREGKRVVLVTKDTFPASDVCATGCYNPAPELKALLPDSVFHKGLLHPDAFKRMLEEACEKEGITLLYFTWQVELADTEKGRLVLAASKGGLLGIACEQIMTFTKEAPPEKLNALLTQDKGQEYGLLTAECTPSGEGMAETLLALRMELLEEFERRRKEQPGLRLGRFALRGYGGREKAGISTAPGRPLRELLPQGYTLSCHRDFDWLPRYPEREYGGDITGSSSTCDLMVVGGGTAGAMAALHGARAGMHTILVEPNYDLGGTATVGGVSTYWFGNRFSDVREIDEEIQRISQQYGITGKEGIWSEGDDFHPGIRGMVLLKLCLEAGVTVRLGELAWAAVLQGETVKGVVTASDSGNHLYLAGQVIDGTGDGDIAVFAGADSCYGSPRNCITYWASLAQYTNPGEYRNNFSSMVACGDPLDYTRFILLGRKRGEKLFDHGSYVSMRESRHIRGLQEVSLKDIISFRTWQDGLYTCFSNYDPKGKLDADMVYMGFLPPQVSIQIPLSALLPVNREGRRIQGLYVAGKAISATHNALPSIRMQPDLMHQGAVLGALLGYAHRQGCAAEELPDCERRSFLLSYTDDSLTLPPWNGNPGRALERICEKSRTHWVDVPFTYREEEQNECLTLLCGDSAELAPLLRQRLEEEENPQTRRLLITIALFHGLDEWTQEYCNMISRELSEGGQGGLPLRQGSVMCAQLLPDHGVMPETVYGLNALGRSKKACIMEPFAQTLALLQESERDYYSITGGIYHYIEAFAYGALHSGNTAFIPMLETLCSFPEFRGILEQEAQCNLLTERLQILYLYLNSALANLGAESGLAGLEELLKAPSLSIRASAAMSLADIRRGTAHQCFTRKGRF